VHGFQVQERLTLLSIQKIFKVPYHNSEQLSLEIGAHYNNMCMSSKRRVCCR